MFHLIPNESGNQPTGETKKNFTKKETNDVHLCSKPLQGVLLSPPQPYPLDVTV
jgi:hypothetical protein